MGRFSHTFAAVLLVLTIVAAPAQGADVQYQGRLKTASFTTTAPITSDVLVCDTNVDRMTFYIYSTKAGTADVYYRAVGGETVAIETGIAVSATTLKVIVINYGLPASYVVFTPSSATSDSMWIDGFAGTHGSTRR